MVSDQEKQRLPVKQNASRFQTRPDSNAQVILGYLPQTESIDSDDKIKIAREEGYDPMAIELALTATGCTAADIIRLLVLVLVASVMVVFFFPMDRFFKPTSGELGSMSIGGPVLEESLSASNLRYNPWLQTLVEIDRLYFQEGKMTEAIELAESTLANVPQNERGNWQKLYYRYWELLTDADRVHVLKTSTRAYLNEFPEDPFANYYHARAFLKAADRMRSFTPETKSAYRREAETIARQIEGACNALYAQKKHPDTKEEKMASLTDLYRKLRLEQAGLYVLIWKLGGYEEDDHPDVAYRDKALDICESEELLAMKEAKALKAVIYSRILDHGNWFEGRQIIQNQHRKRKDFKKELDNIVKELKNAEKI